MIQLVDLLALGIGISLVFMIDQSFPISLLLSVGIIGFLYLGFGIWLDATKEWDDEQKKNRIQNISSVLKWITQIISLSFLFSYSQLVSNTSHIVILISVSMLITIHMNYYIHVSKFNWTRSVGTGFFVLIFSTYPEISLIPIVTTGFVELVKRNNLKTKVNFEDRLKELEHQLWDREELLSTLAHEIRTPLTIIRSAADVLFDGTPGPLVPQQQKFVESIQVNTLRLMQFSDTLIATIKVDSKWQPDQSSRIDLRKLCRSVGEIMQPILDQKKQTIRYSFPALLSRPKADGVWIQQVLVNLVHNASKYTPIGGLIIISVQEQEAAVVVTVSDNGTGLIGSKRDNIFNDFYQENPYSENGQLGTGLGLAIARKVIHKHGGQVYAGTSPGAGTMVSFTLPIESSK